MKSIPFNSQGAILLAGFVLAAIGLAYSPAAMGPLAQSTGTNGNTAQIPNFPAVPSFPAMGNANSNNTMIAVTGIDLTGSAVLFLVDTVNRQMAVYQAMGGSESTQGIKLIAARRIDLDLQLYGFNDKSEYSFEELQKKFADTKRASTPGK
jgi:hypothetical protein